MDANEWLVRYKKRFVEQGGLTAEQVESLAEAESFAAWKADFEDDPEGAADEEMSYWEDDA